MVLARREKYIVITMLGALAVLLLDRLAVTPLQTRSEAMNTERRRLAAGIDSGRVLLERRKQLSDQWQRLLEAGLDRLPPEAESEVLHAVRNWSQEAGFALSSLRPERVAKKGGLQEITFQASGTGSMSSVSQFLWNIEGSSLPVRVAELQLGTRKEGTDDIALQLRISALCRLPDEAKAPAAKVAATKGSGGGAND